MTKIDWFYVWLFLRPDVMFTYFKRWWLFGERPPKETMLVSDRKLTQAEWEYGQTLSEIAEQIKSGKWKGNYPFRKRRGKGKI